MKLQNIAKGMCPECDGLLNFIKEESAYGCLSCEYKIKKEEFAYIKMMNPVREYTEHTTTNTLDYLNNFDK